jgi:hypothetical protein
LTKKLVNRLQAQSFLAVLGASGSGKSSLVMAGMVPGLGMDYAIFQPGADPLRGLKAAREKRLIVVDQFEELFTLTTDPATRNVFITALLALTQKVVITLRSDFLGEVATYRDLNEKIQTHLENIPPMNAAELRHAMEKQADRAGLRFEGDLSQQILEDVEGEPGAMPLLQHALWELWNRRHGHLLSTQEYRDFGGVKQAITQTAEKVYDECTTVEQEQIRDIFLRLTHIDEEEDRRDTRRRIPLGDLIRAGQNLEARTLLLNKLATARLIVQTPSGKQTEVEVTHEALIRHWKRLRTWVHEDRNNLIFHRQLIDDATQWDHSRRDASYLYRDKRLSDAEQWAKTNSSMLGWLEKEFLTAGQVKQSRDRRAVLIRRSGQGVTLASLLAIAIFAFNGGLAFFIYRPLPMDWVPIPAGEFRMGSDDSLWQEEKPAHWVYVDDFELGKYEVTNEQYLRCVKAEVCVEPDNDIFDSMDYVRHPVTDVSWTDAVKFCEWTDPNGSLPTEAEWEKAARGTDERTYPWGNEIDKSYANYEGHGTAEVGSYSKDVSPYGVYDMAGNVWEWVADQNTEYQAIRQTDLFAFHLSAQSPGQSRMIRGGTWGRNELYIRSISRMLWQVPTVGSEIGGFRCARAVVP